MSNNAERDKGLALFAAAWRTVRVNFFDTQRLADVNFDQYEHRFDERIVDEESALACVEEMLAVLGDRFTCLERPEPVTAVPSQAPAEEAPKPVFAGVSSDNIGVLRILTFDREDIVDLVREAAAKLADCKALLIDVRANRGGRMHESLAVASIFVGNGLLSTVKTREEGVLITREYYVNEEQFFATEAREGEDGPVIMHCYEREAPVLAGKPIVLLINTRTSSAAELFSCAIVLNGEPGKVSSVGVGKTRAKGIGQFSYELPCTISGAAVRLSVTRSRWYSPSGEWLGDCGQTVSNGIEADVVLPQDTGPEGLQEGIKLLRQMVDGRFDSVA